MANDMNSPTACSFNDVDIALFSAGGSISKKFGPAAQKAGAIVSSALEQLQLLVRVCSSWRQFVQLMQLPAYSHNQPVQLHAVAPVPWAGRLAAVVHVQLYAAPGGTGSITTLQHCISICNRTSVAACYVSASAPLLLHTQLTQVSNCVNHACMLTSSHAYPQVVDNSSAFRMTEGVPLVIPEVNPEAMSHIKIGGGGAIIANPNCSTIIALMAVTPLHRLAQVKRMIVSTYQAASGAGAAAMEELREQTRDVLEGKEAKPVIFPYQVPQLQ
jgi:aspartate-semialdehyde dehydrogenase